jgi:hypothetical protein
VTKAQGGCSALQQWQKHIRRSQQARRTLVTATWGSRRHLSPVHQQGGRDLLFWWISVKGTMVAKFVKLTGVQASFFWHFRAACRLCASTGRMSQPNRSRAAAASSKVAREQPLGTGFRAAMALASLDLQYVCLQNASCYLPATMAGAAAVGLRTTVG